MMFGAYVGQAPAPYSRAADRSLGETGASLAELLGQVLENGEERREEIGRRLTDALLSAALESNTLVKSEAASRALTLLEHLPPYIPLPEVVVESETEIGLDWDETSQRTLSVTVRESPMIGFSALLGAEPIYGRMPFTGEIPQTLRFLLGRLYPSTSSRRPQTDRG